MTDELQDFLGDLQNSVRANAAADNTYTQTAFVDELSQRLTAVEEIDFLRSTHFEGVVGRKKAGLDGYDFGDEDGQIVLAIAQYSSADSIQTMATTDARRQFALLETFLESSLDGSIFPFLEESSDAHQVATEIFQRKESIFKVRLYLLTDSKLSESIRAFESRDVVGITFEFHLWDLRRLQRVEASELGREEIDIDLTEWAPEGIPVLRTSSGGGLQTLLAVVPGEMLAGIYRKHGGRVLEANVRSFLSTRANVNKGIRGTIQQEPGLFLAYNNGIAATASEATVVKGPSGLALIGVKDLQIVNGGQTTASLFYVQKNDGGDLSEIFVQMKLIVVEELRAAELVPKISRYANTQNRVSEADFFSNHPFHVRMEEKSRRVLTPAKPGVAYQTKWFYERTRGQYLNEKAKVSIAQARRFETEFPRSQLLTKTDAAKYSSSWNQQPHIVSSGAQKNFIAFASQIAKDWESNSDQFGDQYFIDLVCKGILFDAVRSMVQKSDWYSSGYLANIVTYTLAKLCAMIKRSNPGAELDFRQIWAAQEVPQSLLELIAPISKAVFEVLTDDERPIVNVTEWAKREKCWETVLAVNIPVDPGLLPFVMSGSENREERSGARKLQRVDSGIEAQIKVNELGSRYWVKLREFGRSMKLLSEKDLGILRSATGESGRLATEAQASILMGLSAKMEAVGFVGN
jgi:hypothetical protein